MARIVSHGLPFANARWAWGALGLAWAALLAWGLHANWQYKERRYLEQQAAVVATAYRASVDSYALATEILVEETIRQPDVIAIFARGVAGDAAARGQLFRRLAATYDRLRNHGIRQLHFHTATGHSYLRFHALDKYDDPLFELRPSLSIANTEKRAVAGFEAGRGGVRLPICLSAFRWRTASGQRGDQRAVARHSRHDGAQRSRARIRLRDPSRGRAVRAVRGTARAVCALGGQRRFFHRRSATEAARPQLPPSAVVQEIDRRLADDARVREGMAASQTFTLPVHDVRGSHWAVLQMAFM